MSATFSKETMDKAVKYANSNLAEFGRFKTYCKNVGDNVNDGKVLHEFVNNVKSGDLVICDACDEYTKESDTYTARYDVNKLVCETCHNDGN